MPYDGCAGKSGDEIPDVVFEGALLLRSAGIAGGRAVGGDSSGGWWRFSRRRRW